MIRPVSPLNPFGDGGRPSSGDRSLFAGFTIPSNRFGPRGVPYLLAPGGRPSEINHRWLIFLSHSFARCGMARVLMLPSCSLPSSSCFCSGGRSPSCSPRGMTPMKSGRASRPGVSRAHVERGLVGENASLKSVHTKEREARIRKQLQGVKLPPSSYDTAWVAMVPLRGSPQAPRFPQCVEWILENQQDNGSWGIYQFDSSVNKGILLSTLACVLALKRWNVGREDIRSGNLHIHNSGEISSNKI